MNERDIAREVLRLMPKASDITWKREGTSGWVGFTVNGRRHVQAVEKPAYGPWEAQQIARECLMGLIGK